MKKTLYLFFVLAIVACGSRKNTTTSKNYPSKTESKAENLRNLNSTFSGKTSGLEKNIVIDAEKYLGAPYKYAGTTSSGFDCSGFTGKVFSENEVQLPRRSADQALKGQEISIKNVKPSDLLFFATSGNGKVSHVGIVHDVSKDGEVRFIHASTSKGVIISSLNEKYWNKAFLFARRVL